MKFLPEKYTLMISSCTGRIALHAELLSVLDFPNMGELAFRKVEGDTYYVMTKAQWGIFIDLMKSGQPFTENQFLYSPQGRAFIHWLTDRSEYAEIQDGKIILSRGFKRTIKGKSLQIKFIVDEEQISSHKVDLIKEMSIKRKK